MIVICIVCSIAITVQICLDLQKFDAKTCSPSLIAHGKTCDPRLQSISSKRYTYSFVGKHKCISSLSNDQQVFNVKSKTDSSSMLNSRFKLFPKDNIAVFSIWILNVTLTVKQFDCLKWQVASRNLLVKY